MSDQTSHDAKRHREDDADTAPVEPTERIRRAKAASVASDEILDECDRAMKLAVGLDPDEEVDDKEFTKLAEEFNKNFVNRGGQ